MIYNCSTKKSLNDCSGAQYMMQAKIRSAHY
jgi:hypothetical protein